jgi:hypothetical protein
MRQWTEGWPGDRKRATEAGNLQSFMCCTRSLRLLSAERRHQNAAMCGGYKLKPPDACIPRLNATQVLLNPDVIMV